METEQPWLRVDINLAAKLPWGKSRPMPSPRSWTRWAHEVTERLEDIEPLLPDETSRLGPDGQLEIHGWQGMPEIDVECSPGGELRFGGMSLSAWQGVEVPRAWSDSERPRDPDPAEQLEALFARVRRALHIWMECAGVLLEDGQ